MNDLVHQYLCIGNGPGVLEYKRNGWRVRTIVQNTPRWVLDDCSWWKPWTWGSGHVEYVRQEDYLYEPDTSGWYPVEDACQ